MGRIMQRAEFGAKFRERRLATLNEVGRALSQEAVARKFRVSLSTVRGWENNRSWPDERSRIAIVEAWPELFKM